MSQPPNPGNDPQWNPGNPDGTPPQQPGADGHAPIGPDGQPYTGPVGPDGQPYTGPVGPDGQPYTGPDGQPYQDQGAPAQGQGTKFGVKQLLTALVVVAVLGAGAFFLWQNYQKDAALAVGNCLVISGESDDADHELVDCGDADTFSYYVGEVIEGNGTCADEFALAYSISETAGGDENVKKVTCLVPQLAEGTCYAEADGVMDLQPADCGEALLKVTKVTEESGAQCEADESPLSLTHPARTYCIASLEG